jgi:hypothetical protein
LQSNFHRYEAAKLLYQGSLILWRDIQRVESVMGIVWALIGLAEIASIEHQQEHSGWLFGAADHLTPSSGFYRDALDQRAARTREHLDPTATPTFAAAWTKGRTATLEQAIDEALPSGATRKEARDGAPGEEGLEMLGPID